MQTVLVLLSTYNGEKYIQQQLNSLYCQEHVEVSILARDDGSSDNTCDILQRNSEEHNLVWYRGNRLGTQDSYFELMEKAMEIGADYYAFCDQDDVWDEDKLFIAVNKLAGKKEPALYYCGQRLVDENMKFISDHYLNRNRTLKTRFVLSDFAGCTGVFNKGLLERVIQYKPKYMLMHDTWVLRVCICLGGFVYVDPKPHISYRQHGSNTIGLGNGFRGKIRQVKLYLNCYQIEKLTKELVVGFGDSMTLEYKEISKWICNYRTNRECKKELLKKSNVDFCKSSLNIVYKLKILLKRL